MENTTGFELNDLREAIQEEYRVVAEEPERGFHFHTGYRLAGLLGYRDELLDGLPEDSIRSFAGTGNPFRIGDLNTGERVVDVGSGAGFDSLIASRMVGPEGQVTGIDMTDSMLVKARAGSEAGEFANVTFIEGHAEELPVETESTDVVISNGVFNLVPAKVTALREMFRVLKPGGRLQIADILLESAVPESAKQEIDLWTG